MTTNRPLRVFLCHSSADKPAVRELYQQLRAEPWIQPWLDEEDIFPGMDWNLEIQRAIRETDAIIVCLSKGSITKEGYVQREIKTALDYADEKPQGTVYIIPIRLEECKPPERLTKWQYADYFEGNRKRGYERLYISLERRANSLDLKPQKEIQSFIEKETVKRKTQANKLRETEKKALKTDPLFEECVKFAQERGQISAAMIKSKLRIGYTRASQILFTMEREDIIGPAEGEMQTHKFLDLASKPAQISLSSQNKITLSNGMEFMHVPASKFLMGSERHSGDEKPQHIVDIAYDYWIARFHVTNELYNAYVNAKGIDHPKDNWEKKKEHPVVLVTWNDAMDYCQWLNDLMKDGLPSGLVLRLPNEAEWEMAARGTDGREFPWGNEFNKNKCNTDESGNGNTTSVGTYSPQGDSPYGCADMAGNVLEWTHSLKKEYPYNVNDGREDEETSGRRVLRGGSYLYNVRIAYCTYRYDSNITFLNGDIGFRICLAPPLPK